MYSGQQSELITIETTVRKVLKPMKLFGGLITWYKLIRRDNIKDDLVIYIPNGQTIDKIWIYNGENTCKQELTIKN